MVRILQLSPPATRWGQKTAYSVISNRSRHRATAHCDHSFSKIKTEYRGRLRAVFLFGAVVVYLNPDRVVRAVEATPYTWLKEYTTPRTRRSYRSLCPPHSPGRSTNATRLSLQHLVRHGYSIPRRNCVQREQRPTTPNSKSLMRCD
jgi:hypothetical protein